MPASHKPATDEPTFRGICSKPKRVRRKFLAQHSGTKARLDAECMRRYGKKFHRVCPYRFRPGHRLGLGSIETHCRPEPGPRRKRKRTGAKQARARPRRRVRRPKRS
ncbi:hypothetical protein WJX74_000286 [Apatococcus lobatus]|uniref:Uncharacterized protein n=1 Tax=Apatococcus lobatus TaxID=904363 RepID=A0AAW1Q1C5_9CHLO